MQSWRALPAEVYTLVERTAGAVLLESAPGSPASRLFLDPLRVVEARAADSLPQLFRDIEDATAAGMHAAGFLAYECGAALEPSAANKPAMRPNAAASIRAPQNPLQASLQDMPLAWFGIYRQVWVFDHGAGSFVDGDPPGMAGMRVPDAEAARIEMAPELHEAAFARRIAAIHEWIRAGDVYQLNFTFPLRGRAMGGAAAVYARLRARQPVEYGALVHWREGRQVLSFSPELFFAIENSPPPAIPTPMDEIGCPRSLAFGDRGKQDFNPTQFLSRGAALAPPTRRITTRPMKGTARRGRTTAEDAAIAAGLRADEKNCAENVMIVDLLRNDLGRLCRFGSVRAEELFAVERHPTLWQMTSTVTGELRADVGIAEIVQALFPCGSVTGAPKVRAMQLIADLEDGPRDVYTGAIGHFSPERTVFNVAIRTLDIEGEHARMGVGSGVVIDSDAGDEYRECLLKAAFLASDDPEFAPEFALIETLAWRAGYPLLEMHLDRLEDSARYFGFACERDAVRAALQHSALRDSAIRHATKEFESARRVRLLLDHAGAVRIESEALAEARGEILRVCLAAERTDARDRFLFHKTTHRPLYAREFTRAAEEGFADVLFLNRDGEVTEGAISNVFVEKAGRWFTPPVACGLLAGVYRRHLLETRPEIEERVLGVEDLRAADAIYLANAVRGLRRTRVQWN